MIFKVILRRFNICDGRIPAADKNPDGFGRTRKVAFGKPGTTCFAPVAGPVGDDSYQCLRRVFFFLYPPRSWRSGERSLQPLLDQVFGKRDMLYTLGHRPGGVIWSKIQLRSAKPFDVL